MLKIANAQFWVHDQDAALKFYTKTLGWGSGGCDDGGVEFPVAVRRTRRARRRGAGADARTKTTNARRWGERATG